MHAAIPFASVRHAAAGEKRTSSHAPWFEYLKPQGATHRGRDGLREHRASLLVLTWRARTTLQTLFKGASVRGQTRTHSTTRQQGKECRGAPSNNLQIKARAQKNWGWGDHKEGQCRYQQLLPPCRWHTACRPLLHARMHACIPLGTAQLAARSPAKTSCHFCGIVALTRRDGSAAAARLCGVL